MHLNYISIKLCVSCINTVDYPAASSRLPWCFFSAYCTCLPHSLMSSLGNSFPKVRDPRVLNDLFTINDCLKDDASFLFLNLSDNPLTQTDYVYFSAANFESFAKTNNAYIFSTFCLSMRSHCSSKP